MSAHNLWDWTFWLTLTTFLVRGTDGAKGCRFPDKWAGTWFQKGVPQSIRLEGDIFSFKGKCIANDKEWFFIEDSRERCYRCVGIYEKHPNVLQYRETYCDDFKSLKHACSKLTVDGHLYSMFRVNAGAVQCPFTGPFTFTYNRGQGECSYPVSTLDSCTDNTKLVFRFQACADVMNTESSVEELTCLATWKEGSAHYLVGRVQYPGKYSTRHNDHINYRCYIYDQMPPDQAGGYQVSQSGDPTCDGLVSPWEGSRILRVVKSKHPNVGCQFPAWVTLVHKWHTLDGKNSFIFGLKNTSFRITQPEAKVTCTEEMITSDNVSMFVGYSMSGCTNGYVCIAFHRRKSNIIELQLGDYARRKYDACQPPHFDRNHLEFKTLISHTPGHTVCPSIVESRGLRVQAGKGVLQSEVCRDLATTVVGCRGHTTLDFLTLCSTFKHSNSFHCHGDWEENGKVFLITGQKNSRAKYCFVYSGTDKLTQMSGLHDTCHRSVLPGVNGNLTFNISAAGDCEYLLSDTTLALRNDLLLTFLTFAIVALFPR